MASIEDMRRVWGDVLGIDHHEVGLDDNFMDLGGDSVKALQLLGELASYNAEVDLETFTSTGTIQSLWKAMSAQTDNVHKINDHDHNRDEEGLEVAKAHSKSVITTTETGIEDLALAKASLEQDSILCVAPISPVQGFFLYLGLAGNIGLINYVFEVEGSDLKYSLANLTDLLETKNPIFRTLIVEPNDGDFTQVLTSKSSSSWFYPSDLGVYLEKTMTQNFKLGKPAVQYALIMEDAAHKGRSFFVISLHHTHCDAFSRFLISKEISQILESPSDYAGNENMGRPWFGDYVKHVQLKNTEDKASSFWDDYLGGANLANIHPPDRATINGELDGAIIEKVQVSVSPRMANSNPRNPTQIILAAWAIALANFSGLRDITFGLCRHGRSSGSFPGVRRVMGPLLNALPFRVSLDSHEESISTLLQRIQKEITSTNKWEHGSSPSIFPSADGRPWVQSLVDLKSELHGMGNGLSARNAHPTITKMIPRPDLDIYEIKSNWSILLYIKQQRNAFQVSMYYQKPLLPDAKAAELFENFKACIQTLSATHDSLGKLLKELQC